MTTTFNTDVIYKVIKEGKKDQTEMGNLYFTGVPVVYAQVHKPAKKYNSEDRAYQIGLFINSETKDKLDDIGLNKELAQVGVTKVKKGVNRGKLKYDPKNEAYTDYEGMFGAQFSRDVLKKDGSPREPLAVIDTDMNAITDNVGNGSVCNVKMFAYRNDEDMLVVMLDTVQVIDLVPYEDNGVGYDDVLGGVVTRPVSAPETSEDVPAPQEPPATEEEDEGDRIPF